MSTTSGQRNNRFALPMSAEYGANVSVLFRNRCGFVRLGCGTAEDRARGVSGTRVNHEATPARRACAICLILNVRPDQTCLLASARGRRRSQRRQLARIRQQRATARSARHAAPPHRPACARRRGPPLSAGPLRPGLRDSRYRSPPAIPGSAEACPVPVPRR